MASEYCSTFARALQLVLPPARVRSERTALWAERTEHPLDAERLTERQRALLAALPRVVAGERDALRRLERRGWCASVRGSTAARRATWRSARRGPRRRR